jgi:hypothetical protein
LFLLFTTAFINIILLSSGKLENVIESDFVFIVDIKQVLIVVVDAGAVLEDVVKDMDSVSISITSKFV